MNKIVALLPMKANSTRVPGKNFKEFCGKPLFKWVLDTLLSVSEIDKVIINTDAKEILLENGLVESNRIIIRQRPDEICGDEISMNRVIEDDVQNVSSEIYLMTHTTNPLLSRKTIIEAINKFKMESTDIGVDSVFTVNKIQTRFYRADGSAINHDPDNLIPTQNLEPWFEENSNLYLFTAESFSKTKARIGERPAMLETPLIESLDIDTPDEWDMGVNITNYLLATGKIEN